MHRRLMSQARYPLALSADDVIADIEKRRVADPASSVGYECLFIAPASTRPAMEFELFPEALSSPDWKEHVIERVQRAKSEARNGETVYFEPYDKNVR